MRKILLGLLLLAAAKIWYQDHAYRTAMGEAVIEAYRERAIEVCRRNAPKRPAGARADATVASTVGSTVSWGPASSIEAVIGNPDINVAIWDTQNPLWTQRFRDPHLILTATTNSGSARCAYDVHEGGAKLSLR